MLKKNFKRVFLALDTNQIKLAVSLVNKLKGHLAGIKVGKELFSLYGPQIVKKLKKFKLPIFLDLKFHDIPTTVYKSVKAIKKINPNYLSIHSLGGDKMIRSAVKASGSIKILAVTLLSHHEEKDLKKMGINVKIKNQIKIMAQNIIKNKAHGIILGAQDLNILKNLNKRGMLIFVPGIRPKNSNKNEHKRSLDPVGAIKNGADYIIIGRPITKAKNPKDILMKINHEIKNYLKKKNGN